jgi:phosphoglycerol transferase
LLLAAVLIIGFLDQTNPSYVPTYRETRAEFESDAAFFGTVEDRLGAGAAVFQLPYVPFPEWNASGEAMQFDSFRGYLHSSDLRWSYGAMYARPQDWQPGLIDETVEQALARVSAVGFSGIVIDRRAYPDGGAELEGAIAEEAEVDPIVSTDDRYAFFDLRPYGQKLREALTPGEIESLRSATLNPLIAEPGPGLNQPIAGGSFSPNLEMLGPTAQLSLVNPSSAPRQAQLDLALQRDAGPGLDVVLPTGRTERVRPGRPLHEKISLPPGTITVDLEANGDAGPGLLQLRLFDATLEPLEHPRGGVSLQP